MARNLPSGAYLIRNKQTGTVIEVPSDSDKVVTANENPNGRREQQLWWIEALPGHEHESKEGAVYSITNIPRNVAIDTAGSAGFGLRLKILEGNGHAWQKWWIKRTEDNYDEFYNIISVYDGGAIDIEGNNPIVGALCHISKFAHQSDKQRWEFVSPTVAIPPGWVQIRSVSPNPHLLQQTYFTSPPFLAPETPLCALSNDRMNWGTQWMFVLGDQRDVSTQRYWCIRNRLTGGFLLHSVERWRQDGQKTTLNAAETRRYSSHANMMWRLDLHRDGYWTFTNKESSLLLERESSAGTQVTLGKRDSPVGNGHRKWEVLEFYKMVRLGVIVEENTDV